LNEELTANSRKVTTDRPKKVEDPKVNARMKV
jgi:hypothetical protein